MLTLKSLNPKGSATTKEIDANLAALLSKLLKVEAAYGKNLTITSGLRDTKDHLRIYAQKNAALAAKGLPAIKIPMGSKHLSGQAADLADADGELWKWCMVHMDLFVDLGLYFEDKSATPTWVHVQSTAPSSGKRIFKP